ncbi:MAG: hypothetical protein II767_01605 [Proteobacteria bacterium]|nr:hypothetical protein [Pseudomonadota bacterium]MBQ4358931.1 hypothetical protein [Pseudomonadota bacterium]
MGDIMSMGCVERPWIFGEHLALMRCISEGIIRNICVCDAVSESAVLSGEDAQSVASRRFFDL